MHSIKRILYFLVMLSLSSYGQWQKQHHMLMNAGYEKVYTSINEALMFPDKVVILDLSGKKLTKIPDEIFQLKNLKELYLGSIQGIDFIIVNNIRELPKGLFQLKKLEILDLDSNDIKYIPPEIKSLTNLKILNLRGNPVKKLPPEIKYLKRLEILDIGFTKIKELPEEFGELKSLKRLHIDRTKIKHFPASTTKLLNLEYVKLFGTDDKLNLEETIDLLSALPKFREISMPVLSEIPENIINLKALEILSIVQHNFKDLKKPFITISKIKSLKFLRLYDYGSDIVIPPEIGLLTQLEHIELDFSGGISLPKEISHLKNLKQFGFSECVRSGIEYLNKNCEIY